MQDTEALVSIELDSHRNQLTAIDLVITLFSASLAIISCVSGLFGMNVLNPWNSDHAPDSNSMAAFTSVSLIASGAAIMVFSIVLRYVSGKKLFTL